MTGAILSRRLSDLTEWDVLVCMNTRSAQRKANVMENERNDSRSLNERLQSKDNDWYRTGRENL
jgi:hypothetical protein